MSRFLSEGLLEAHPTAAALALALVALITLVYLLRRRRR